MTPYQTFRAQVLSLYRPPIRRAATWRKMKQVLGEFAAHCPTTDDITPAAIAAWMCSRPARTPPTAFTLLRTFRSGCRAGLALGLLRGDPFAFRAPRAWFAAGALEPPERRRHHPAADIARALALADREVELGRELSWAREWRCRRLRALAYLAAYTGARRNELLGLRVEDVDLGRRLIHLAPNEARPLKTAGSRAPVPIPGPAADHLGPWLARCGSPWLFPGSRRLRPWLGGLAGYRAVDQLRQLGERAGVAGLTFLSLRHTYATLAEGWGLGELELQRILRHSRASTQRHYRHVDLELIRAAGDKVRFSLD